MAKSSQVDNAREIAHLLDSVVLEGSRVGNTLEVVGKTLELKDVTDKLFVLLDQMDRIPFDLAIAKVILLSLENREEKTYGKYDVAGHIEGYDNFLSLLDEMKSSKDILENRQFVFTFTEKNAKHSHCITDVQLILREELHVNVFQRSADIESKFLYDIYVLYMLATILMIKLGINTEININILIGSLHKYC